MNYSEETEEEATKLQDEIDADNAGRVFFVESGLVTLRAEDLSPGGRGNHSGMRAGSVRIRA